MGRTRGSEPPDRIRRKEARGGGLRRRTLATRKRGNGGGATRIKFKVVGVSPGFKEFISGVGWGRATPWRSGDERRPPGASGDGSRDEAVATAGRRGTERARPGKEGGNEAERMMCACTRSWPRQCGTELDEADAEAHAAIGTARQRGGSRGASS
uniref:DUF591 domain-containing protein n=1 Tax=Oryza rufipogon TaxID=4529 RepID=A0A0E0Q9D3_ORYRU